MHTRFVIAGLLTGAALTGYCAAQQKLDTGRTVLRF
jgi:hypothetical protein